MERGKSRDRKLNYIQLTNTWHKKIVVGIIYAHIEGRLFLTSELLRFSVRPATRCQGNTMGRILSPLIVYGWSGEPVPGNALRWRYFNKWNARFINPLQVISVVLRPLWGCESMIIMIRKQCLLLLLQIQIDKYYLHTESWWRRRN